MSQVSARLFPTHAPSSSDVSKGRVRQQGKAALDTGNFVTEVGRRGLWYLGGTDALIYDANPAAE
jgi:hypothetical protein